MAVMKLYMQQLIYDGTSYTQGAVVDVLSQWNIGVSEFPFSRYPESKDIAKRDWKGTDGVEIYTPTGGLPLKDYDVDVTFLYSGTKTRIQADLNGFLDFIYGRGAVGLVGGVGSGRLAIYDDHVADGKKDVYVVSVANELYWNVDTDDDTIATFKVKFHVADPVTDVVVERNQQGVVTGMTWDDLNANT